MLIQALCMNAKKCISRKQGFEQRESCEVVGSCWSALFVAATPLIIAKWRKIRFLSRLRTWITSFLKKTVLPTQQRFKIFSADINLVYGSIERSGFLFSTSTHHAVSVDYPLSHSCCCAATGGIKYKLRVKRWTDVRGCISSSYPHFYLQSKAYTHLLQAETKCAVTCVVHRGAALVLCNTRTGHFTMEIQFMLSFFFSFFLVFCWKHCELIPKPTDLSPRMF